MGVTFHSFKDFQPKITAVNGAWIDGASMAQAILSPWDTRKSAPAFIPGDVQRVAVVIDGVIQAAVAKDTLRTEQKDLWGSEFAQKRNLSISTGLATVLFAGGAFISKSTPPAALAMFSVACLIGTAVLGSKAWTASTEKAGWSIDPVEVIAKRRTEAYAKGVKGFHFAFTEGLKIGFLTEAVLLPAEVNYMYKEYAPDFCNKRLVVDPFAPKDKHEWLLKFLDLNPVSKVALEYAYNGFAAVPQKYREVTNFYETLAGLIRETQTHFKSKRDERTREKDQNIQTIETYRDATLAPFKAYHNLQLQAALRNRYEALRTVQPNDLTRKREIEDEYSSEVARQNLIYAAFSTPIYLYAANEIAKVEESYRTAIAKINADETQALILYYPLARQCITATIDLINQPDDAPAPVPSAPPLSPYEIPPVYVFVAPEASAPFEEAINVAVGNLGEQLQHSAEVVEYRRLLAELQCG